MLVIHRDEIQNDARRSQMARACATLFLVLSTLMMVKVQQSRFESSGSSRSRQKYQFEWEGSPFLMSSRRLLTAVYLSKDLEFASVFQSQKGEDKQANTLLTASSSDFLWAEDSQRLDPFFVSSLRGDIKQFPLILEKLGSMRQVPTARKRDVDEAGDGDLPVKAGGTQGPWTSGSALGLLAVFFSEATALGPHGCPIAPVSQEGVGGSIAKVSKKMYALSRKPIKSQRRRGLRYLSQTAAATSSAAVHNVSGSQWPGWPFRNIGGTKDKKMAEIVMPSWLAQVKENIRRGFDEDEVRDGVDDVPRRCYIGVVGLPLSACNEVPDEVAAGNRSALGLGKASKVEVPMGARNRDLKSSWSCGSAQANRGLDHELHLRPDPVCVRLISASTVGKLRRDAERLLKGSQAKVSSGGQGRTKADEAEVEGGASHREITAADVEIGSFDRRSMGSRDNDSPEGVLEGLGYESPDSLPKVPSLRPFCGRPVRHLMAFDRGNGRIFFVESLPTPGPSAVSAVPSSNTSSINTESSASKASSKAGTVAVESSGRSLNSTASRRLFMPNESLAQKSRENWEASLRRRLASDRNVSDTSASRATTVAKAAIEQSEGAQPQIAKYCIAIYDVKAAPDGGSHRETGEISKCLPIPVPKAVALLEDRPPVYIHYEEGPHKLVIFQFDTTSSLIVTAMETIPALAVKFSVRLQHLSSGWLLASDEVAKSSILLLGSEPPYLGVVHVVDLETGKDARLDLERIRNFDFAQH